MRAGRWTPLVAVIGLLLVTPGPCAPLPASTGAPAVGAKAPDFTLPDTNGTLVTLSRLSAPEGGGKGSWVLLVFYRGYW